MTTYNIYRRDTPESQRIKIKSDLTSLQNIYYDETVESGKTYIYNIGVVIDGIEKLSNDLTVSVTLDEHINNVVALHDFESFNDTTVIDQLGKTWLLSVNSSITTDISKFGSKSLLIPVDANGYEGLRMSSNHPWMRLGGNGTPFTVECWVKSYTNSYNGNEKWICGLYNYASNRRSWRLGIQTGTLKFQGGNGTGAIDLCSTSGTLILDGNWHHVAVTMDGARDYRLFVDGVLKSSVRRTSNLYNNTVDSMAIGGQINLTATGNAWANSWTGYIDEFRLTYGTCRYTSNFTVQTKKFPKF